jgi:hypothetical protein
MSGARLGLLHWPREFEFGQLTQAVAIDFSYQLEKNTMRFPNTEGEIGKLAQFMISGLTSNQELFPAPPVPSDELRTRFDTYVSAREAAVDASGVAARSYTAKDEALEELVADLKSNIRYAENTADFDDDKLKTIGWGGRASKNSLQTPGQVGSLSAPREGPGWLLLEWKQPPDGGKVSAYRIQRRRHTEEVWDEAGMSVETHALISGQERGVALVYHVIAVNKAGEGEPSNIVTTVL